MTLKEFIGRECELVIEQVCGSQCVERDRLLGTAKAANVVKARREVMRLLTERGFTLKHIAWGLKRHRATVYHWCASEKFRETRRAKSREYYSRKKLEVHA